VRARVSGSRIWAVMSHPADAIAFAAQNLTLQKRCFLSLTQVSSKAEQSDEENAVILFPLLITDNYGEVLQYIT